jgi:hypothetical protein
MKKFLKQLKTFKDEVVRFVREGAPIVTSEVYEIRLNTCAECPHLKDYRCGICGCVVEEKAKWETAECPDKRWKDEGEGDNTETGE